MATPPDRVDPVFGDALAGDGGLAEPVSTGPRRDLSFDVFPDALSALPLPALTWVVPPAVGTGAPPGTTPLPGTPSSSPAWPAAADPRRSTPPVRSRTAAPTGPVWSGYPPPGRPAPLTGPPAPFRQARPAVSGPTGGVLAPGSGRRPVAGLGYTPPPTSAAGVVRPPAYLPQNPGLTQLRAAVQQVRPGGNRPPASTPGLVRPSPPTGTRRGNRASSTWSVIVFALIVLVSTGLGQKIIDAITDLLRSR